MPSVKFNTKELTTNTGAPIISNEFSLKAGNRGRQPISLVLASCIPLQKITLIHSVLDSQLDDKGPFLAAGPVLLEDYHLLEKLGQFNREKIPERVVHARGMGAKGFFEVHADFNHTASWR